MVEAATSFVSGIKSTLTFMAASTTEHQQQNDPTNEEQNSAKVPAPEAPARK